MLWCKPWELARGLGLRHYYVYFNGNANGAVAFYRDNEFVAKYAVLAERGRYETLEQHLGFLEGQVLNEATA